MCVNSEGSGETTRMRRLAWTFVGRLYDTIILWLKWLEPLVNEHTNLNAYYIRTDSTF